MLLAEGIRNSSTIDKREMNIFFNERRFWRNVLERLIDITLFLSERNLAFRGSEEVLEIFWVYLSFWQEEIRS